MAILCKLILFIIILSPASALAHGHGHEGFDAELHALTELFEQAIQLEAVLFEDDPSAARLDPKWKRQQALLDSGAWQLMSGWLRIYYRDLHKDCPHDHGLKEEDLLAELHAEAARGGMINRFHDKVISGVGGLAQESADIGARLGRTALLVKVAAEVAETVLSKAVGGGGVHIICGAIDAALLFGTRHVQTAFRTFAMAPQFNQSRMLALFRSAYVHNRAKHLFRKMQLVAGPIELDPHEVEEVDDEGPNRWWGFVHDGKRARLLKKLGEKSAASQTVRSNFKKFSGARYKRLLFLRARKRGYSGYLKGKAPMDDVLHHKGTWILALQEGILNRPNALVKSEPRSLDEDIQFAPEGPVGQGLLDEVQTKHGLNPAQREGLGMLLNDIEYIFDPQKSYNSRYTRVAALESLLTVFMYRMLKAAWEESGQDDVSAWSEVYRTAKERWVQGRFVSVVHEFADYMSVGATSKDSAQLTSAKYASQDFLLRIFSHLQLVLGIQHGSVSGEQLQASLSELIHSRPWVNRESPAQGWIFRRAPLCENL